MGWLSVDEDGLLRGWGDVVFILFPLSTLGSYVHSRHKVNAWGMKLRRDRLSELQRLYTPYRGVGGEYEI